MFLFLNEHVCAPNSDQDLVLRTQIQAACPVSKFSTRRVSCVFVVFYGPCFLGGNSYYPIYAHRQSLQHKSNVGCVE
jgi:hypothetical protein